MTRIPGRWCPPPAPPRSRDDLRVTQEGHEAGSACSGSGTDRHRDGATDRDLLRLRRGRGRAVGVLPGGGDGRRRRRRGAETVVDVALQRAGALAVTDRELSRGCVGRVANRPGRSRSTCRTGPSRRTGSAAASPRGRTRPRRRRPAPSPDAERASCCHCSSEPPSTRRRPQTGARSSQTRTIEVPVSGEPEMSPRLVSRPFTTALVRSTAPGAGMSEGGSASGRWLSR